MMSPARNLALVSSFACKTLSILCLVLFLGSVARAQTTETNHTPDNVTGLVPFQTYEGLSENINIAAGNLHLEIPIVGLPGRNGQNFKLNLNYDSKFWHTVRTCSSSSGHLICTNSWQPGKPTWKLSLPTYFAQQADIVQSDSSGRLSCTDKYVLTEETGARIAFPNWAHCMWAATGR